MRSTWATIDGIVELLQEAQLGDDTVPFDLVATLKIYPYEPRNFALDGIAPTEGVYIYFSETDFQRPDGGVHDVSHAPEIFFDFIVAKRAEKNGTTGVMTPSDMKTEAALRTVVSQTYDVIQDTRFLRYLNDKITANIAVLGEFKCSEVWVSKAQKLGVIPQTESSKAMAVFRFTIQPDISEIHNNNPGIAYGGTDDRLIAYRTEDQYEEPTWPEDPE